MASFMTVDFSEYSGVPVLHQLSWPPRYNWNIVESGIKYHNPPPRLLLFSSKLWNIHTLYIHRTYGSDDSYHYHLFTFYIFVITLVFIRPCGRRGCDRMIVGFTTTYAINAYHHWVRISIRARCTTLCDKGLSVTCDRSVVFSHSHDGHMGGWKPMLLQKYRTWINDSGNF
jgi:hypothetical protein